MNEDDEEVARDGNRIERILSSSIDRDDSADYPACLNAYMHPAAKPTMSSGGGGWTNTYVSEDWVLRYPKCTGANKVACDQVQPGTLCSNCQWQNDNQPESCRDTLAHEHGHTADLHRPPWAPLPNQREYTARSLVVGNSFVVFSGHDELLSGATIVDAPAVFCPSGVRFHC